MKVKMNVSMAFADGSVYAASEVVEVTDAVAHAWVEAGIADFVGGYEPQQELKTETKQKRGKK